MAELIFGFIIGVLIFFLAIVDSDMRKFILIVIVLVTTPFVIKEFEYGKKEMQVRELVKICMKNGIKLPNEFKPYIKEILEKEKNKEIKSEISNYLK